MNTKLNFKYTLEDFYAEIIAELAVDDQEAEAKAKKATGGRPGFIQSMLAQGGKVAGMVKKRT